MNKVKRIIKNRLIWRTGLTGLAFIVGFLVFAFLGIQGWEFTNSTWFCTTVCHDVHPEEPSAYADSYHARVKCVECHMGRKGVLETIALKSTHSVHLVTTPLGLYERPTEAKTMRPAADSCELCHWPPAFHGDTVREIKHFQPDEQNTETRTYLILKTGGGERAKGLGGGIHWHIENPVEYIATDEHKQDIPWVKATLPDGRTVEYSDVTQPLTADQIARSTKRTMDCMDCHNRVGHPFLSPEQLVDQALADGQLNAKLPYAKKEMLALLAASYPDQQAAQTAVASVETRYKAQYPQAAAMYAADIQRAVQLANDLIYRLVFDRPGVTWQSFPDNDGHKEFAGCFRCHDGKHLSSSGESIRLHCNICHSIPVTVRGNARPPQMPVATLQEPASHLATNFMADHRFQANGGCEPCHGKVAFGTDDSSFCANSACHGQKWPSVGLDAAFPHPIQLEGQHARTLCHSCHNGVKKPEYKCANCHQPPSPTHYGESCNDCHSLIGWQESGALLISRAPALPHPTEGRENCMQCHDPAGQIKPAPASHKSFTAQQCATCHKPQPPEASPAAGETPPQIPHPTEGRDNCLQCHDPAGQIKPAPASHKTYTASQCVTCHQPRP